MNMPTSPPAVKAWSPAPRRTIDAHGVVVAELAEDLRELVARAHADAVELVGHVERDRRDAAVVLARDAEAVVLGHVVPSVVRSMRRRSLPDALFGSASTKR